MIIVMEFFSRRMCIFFAILTICFTRAPVEILAQNEQLGFISIDCGLPQGSNYTDDTTGIYYVSDTGFTDSGVSKTISPTYNSNSLVKQMQTLRSFPQGTRNCYTIKPLQGKGTKYLIRAGFMYGDYDSKGEVPIFDIHLGVDKWDTVNLVDESTALRLEMIHVLSSDYVQVCLVNTGSGIPFISALELRVLNISMYETKSGSLRLYARVDFTSLSKQIVRYKDDILDRMWKPFNLSDTSTLSTTSDIDPNMFQPPSVVMRTAVTPLNASNGLEFYWTADNTSVLFYIYMHFAEVVQLQKPQYRAFNINLNGTLWYGPLVPDYLSSTTIRSVFPTTGYTKYEFTINRTSNSTLPPIINALEVYTMIELKNLQTDDNDVEATMSIKSTYGLTRNWQGDPCSPQDFVWNGVQCQYGDLEISRVVALNLSSSGLNGTIAPSISDLILLKTLDLSNNNLSGHVPDSLSQLSSLRVLNLKGNNFTGISEQLLQKSKDGSLSLSIDLPGGGGGGGNKTTDSCGSESCGKGNKKLVIPIVAAIVGASLLLLAALLILCMIKRKRHGVVKKVDTELSYSQDKSFELRSRQFTYAQVVAITNNFQKIIGRGGFGTVFHGYVDNTQVAVKMLSPSSTQGYKEFQAEAHLLTNVHHKNLTELVGYCNEGTNMGIIYEFMANGNLATHLSDKNPYSLTWEERLVIAVDAAEGLEYLHHGCKPPIIHRDVKTTNILLNEKLGAKLADFGLSRAFPVEGGTHVSTVAAGTPGYLDPEYYVLGRLTEKSDVYSFGVVVLEIITGRSTILKKQGEPGLTQWVNSTLERGDVKNAVDPKLRGNFDVNSIWKAVEVAMACVSRNSIKRPSMNYVVLELKECLAMEMARHHPDSNNSIGTMPMASGLTPMAR